MGDWRTGNNYGDSKVINAAANAFGQISIMLGQQSWLVRAAVKCDLRGSAERGSVRPACGCRVLPAPAGGLDVLQLPYPRNRHRSAQVGLSWIMGALRGGACHRVDRFRRGLYMEAQTEARRLGPDGCISVRKLGLCIRRILERQTGLFLMEPGRWFLRRTVLTEDPLGRDGPPTADG